MSAPRLCFIANFNKTEFFHAWAQALGPRASETRWITTNRRLYRWLSERYPVDQILLINWETRQPKAEPLGEFRLRELVFGDRCLRHRMEEGIHWLTAIQQPIAEFLGRNGVTRVLGEVTWAHEILIHRMTRELPGLGCTYLNPHTVRIPNGRFAFFLDEFQTELLPSGAELPGEEELAQAFTVRKPDYLALNDRLLQQSRSLGARLGKVKRYLTRENIDPLDPTLIDDRWLQFRLRAREEWNKEAYRRVPREPMETLQGQRFAFLTLHKQPEASIDVLGRYVEDQLHNIEALWRRLPAGCLLVVKEHTNAIGDRAPAFYRDLLRLPGVVLVDERADSHVLAAAAEIVLTVSGTAAYEAALLGKRSATLVPAFFNRLRGCRHLGAEAPLGAGFSGEVDEAGMDREAFGRWLWQHSHPGIISDPRSNPACMVDSNLQSLAYAVGVIGDSLGQDAGAHV